jgi:hypothetical protein
LAPLTRVNRPHHQPNGFDQAKELDRVCHCKVMRIPPFTKPTFRCSNCVTNMWPALGLMPGDGSGIDAGSRG